MPPSVRTLQGSKIKSFKGSASLCPRGQIRAAFPAIIDARKLYQDKSLADMYGENMYLYPELLTAHQNNDRAVMQTYGFPVKSTFTEGQCVAELFKLYKEKTK